MIIWLRSWFSSVMKVLHVICLPRLVFHTFIENKESQDLSLYNDILQLTKKSWHKVRASYWSHLYLYIIWCRHLPPPLFVFFFFHHSTQHRQNILKSCLRGEIFFFRSSADTSCEHIWSYIASSDIAKWVYTTTKSVFLLTSTSKFQMMSGIDKAI